MTHDAYQIAFAIEHDAVEVDEQRLRRGLTLLLREAEMARAAISVAVVDDETIHRLNRQYLDHDYATDVLSFVLERDGAGLEGEIVVSADTAAAAAPRYGWSAADELLLYVLHGALHLVGHKDGTPEEAAEMRRREDELLAALDVQRPDPQPQEPGARLR